MCARELSIKSLSRRIPRSKRIQSFLMIRQIFTLRSYYEFLRPSQRFRLLDLAQPWFSWVESFDHFGMGMRSEFSYEGVRCDESYLCRSSRTFDQMHFHLRFFRLQPSEAQGEEWDRNSGVEA